MNYIIVGEIICPIDDQIIYEFSNKNQIKIPISREPIDDPDCIIGFSRKITSKLSSKNQIENYPEGNWFIPNIAAFGACPYISHNVEWTMKNLKTLCSSFGLIVCLQKEYPKCSEYSEYPKLFDPYIEMIPYYEQLIIDKIAKDPVAFDLDHDWTPPDFKICRIPDCGVVNDSIIGELAELCICYIKRNIPIYIHCWGGHGRAGTLAGIILAKMYKWKDSDILKYLQTVHDYRPLHIPCKCPQKSVQVEQIKRFIKYD